MTKSQDSKIRRDTYCLDRVVEEKDQNLKGEDRLEEILRRNSFYLPHLKSSYPLEELHLSAKDIQKLVESPVDPMGRSNDDLTYVARGEIFRQAVKKIKQVSFDWLEMRFSSEFYEASWESNFYLKVLAFNCVLCNFYRFL